MKIGTKDIRWSVTVALMMAIVILLANTPLGMIQLPVIKATTVHIPVIVGAIVLGPMAGGILGVTFGGCSMISNTVAPTLLSFAFSPFLSTTGLLGAGKAIWISVGCRMVFGIVVGWLWILMRKIRINQNLCFVIVPFLSSLFHTILVMGSIYALLAPQYAAAKEVAVQAVLGLIMGTILGSGIPEAIAAMIIGGILAKVLVKIYHVGHNRAAG